MNLTPRQLKYLFIIPIIVLTIVACRDNNDPNQVVENPTSSPAASSESTPTATAIATTEPAEIKGATETPTATPVVTASNTPTDMPPTATATATSSPTATATEMPTETPSPTATNTPIPIPPPEWLSYVNRFRAMANLPTLSDREAITLGSELHSRYMVVNDKPIAHSEAKDNPWYDEAGDQAAKNGNIFATSQIEADYLWSVNFWISAPFHLIGLLDPRLELVGYGDHNEAIGNINMAAVMDIRSAPPGPDGLADYPIFFPGDGSETWVVRHSLFEWPNPFGSCPGYSRPSGAPIVLLLGDGSITPNVTSHRLAKGDQPLESCLYDETSYRNSNQYAQQIGRTILDLNDAIVIIPREQLPIDETYSVQVTVNGQSYNWQFSTRRGPPE